MVKERNNAVVATVVLVGLLVLHCKMVEAVTHVVGGESGWTYGVQTWPYKKKFKAGDTLVFNYSPKEHNVVSARKKEYDKCNPSYDSKVYNTGHDKIIVKKGENYFISGFKGQCASGLKLFVHAE
ncbi:basic blue protein-like [Pistacia vera]|uniref:basic blue protein-like n=1 Tax=Pistacia vera TaxID=55513 RepID=UPI001262B590|nr:basic blue protein-like [Pistacia vera]